MKQLRHCGVSYNGQRLARDEFAYELGPGGTGDERGLYFYCPSGANRICAVRITRGKAVHPVWHWDGNVEAPTVTPSIGCDVPPRCGWHGSITKGVAEPSRQDSADGAPSA